MSSNEVLVVVVVVVLFVVTVITRKNDKFIPLRILLFCSLDSRLDSLLPSFHTLLR
jgi:hypothetical protein